MYWRALSSKKTEDYPTVCGISLSTSQVNSHKNNESSLIEYYKNNDLSRSRMTLNRYIDNSNKSHKNNKYDDPLSICKLKEETSNYLYKRIQWDKKINLSLNC